MTVAAHRFNSSSHFASARNEEANGHLVPRPALVVSMSGLQDATLLSAARFYSQLESRGIVPALLVAPHQGKDWSLRNAPAVRSWIQRREAEGAELLLAGFDQSVRGRITEFRTASRHEAKLRLTAAIRQMERLGFDIDMFAPPKWAMSQDTIDVLPELGFRIAADIHGVHDLVTGATDPTRVLGMGEGFGGARWWRKAMHNSANRLLLQGRPIRLSVSASKLSNPKVRKDFLRIIDHALEIGAQPAGYRQVPLKAAA